MAQNLFQVDLTLTEDNGKDLRVLTDRIREEIYPNEAGWYRLGSLLLKMGESEQAQQISEFLLKLPTNNVEKGRLYHRLGLAKYDQCKYKEALRFYGKALAIRQSFPPNHPDLAFSYNNIDLVYEYMGDYSKARSFT
jgi:tetratricopeptide (TPR) repeat protein